MNFAVRAHDAYGQKLKFSRLKNHSRALLVTRTNLLQLTCGYRVELNPLGQYQGKVKDLQVSIIKACCEEQECIRSTTRCGRCRSNFILEPEVKIVSNSEWIGLDNFIEVFGRALAYDALSALVDASELYYFLQQHYGPKCYASTQSLAE